MRILVLRGGALGDFLVTLPALDLLRRRWPHARIELAGNLPAATLAVHRGLLDAAHSQHEARWSTLYGPAPLPGTFAAWLGGFDLIVSFWPDPEGELKRRFPVRPEQMVLSAAAHPLLAPAAAHYCEPLQGLDLTPGPWVYPLRTAVPGSRTVALHPGSGAARKNWPADRWEALAGWLRHDLGLEIVVITGEAESADLLAGHGTPLRQQPLDEVANHLAHCRLFIGHDSGISHLAAAAGAPCLLLFGPTDPAMWAPPAASVTVIRRGSDLSAISLAEVQDGVAAALAGQS